jgi:hypothetical protein
MKLCSLCKHGVEKQNAALQRAQDLKGVEAPHNSTICNTKKLDAT